MRDKLLHLMALCGMVLCPLAARAAEANPAPSGPGVVESIDRPAGVAVAEAPEDRVSATIAVEYSTHFVSYGFDVWGAGEDWDMPSTFISGTVTWDLDGWNITTGVWSDNNDNVESAIGGDIQEIDWWIGVGYELDRLTLGATYQAWHYAGLDPIEKILDLSVAFDDEGVLAEGFALNPSFIAHRRLAGEGMNEGWAFVLSVAPGMPLGDEEEGWTLSFPTSVAFFESGFHGGDSGFGFFSVGPKLTVPLDFIPEKYGDWAAYGSVIYYVTDEEVIPGNVEESFLVGQIGASVGL